MLALDDSRWNELVGGYRVRFDPRPYLAQIEAGLDTDKLWNEFWGEIHHQGDVGEASYAAIPHLVRIYKKRASLDWNFYAIAAVIELARENKTNPPVPDWMKDDYFLAIQELSAMGATEIMKASAPDTVRAILSVISLAKGLRTHGRFFLTYSEEEMLEFESRI